MAEEEALGGEPLLRPLLLAAGKPHDLSSVAVDAILPIVVELKIDLRLS